MKTAYAWLLTSILATAAQAAPAPQFRELRHAPNPQIILDRLRAEGFDVTGLKHVGGDRWTLDHVTVMIPPMSIVVVPRVIVAPGDPTAKLRGHLLMLQPR